MNKFICTILFFCFHISSYAHNANEAYFWYTTKDNTIEVEAEFPWSIRNALLQFEPSLRSSKSKVELDTALKTYLKANLKLKDCWGKELPLLSVKAIKRNGHSHQNNYLLQFNGSHFSQVENTVMLNLYEAQLNYNFFKITSGEELTKVTGKDATIIQLKSYKKYIFYRVLIVFSLLCLGFTVYKVFVGK